MKNTDISQAWDRVNPDESTSARMLSHITQRQATGRMATQSGAKTLHWPSWRILAPVFACLVIGIGVAIPLATRADTLPLIDSQGVIIEYATSLPEFASSADLVPMTEEELLTGTDIFSGTVTHIRTIKVSFSDRTDHWSVLTVRVDDSLRSRLTTGQTTSILVYPPVGITCSICTVSSHLEEGSSAIFLATPTGSDASAQSLDGSEVFSYSDVAEFYLADPSRPLFIDTNSGVLFDTWGWPSLAPEAESTQEHGVSRVGSMGIIEDFIRSMIG